MSASPLAVPDSMAASVYRGARRVRMERGERFPVRRDPSPQSQPLGMKLTRRSRHGDMIRRRRGMAPAVTARTASVAGSGTTGSIANPAGVARPIPWSITISISNCP